MGLLAMNPIGPLRSARSRPGFMAHVRRDRLSSESWLPISWGIGVRFRAKVRDGRVARGAWRGLAASGQAAGDLGVHVSRCDKCGQACVQLAALPPGNYI